MLINGSSPTTHASCPQRALAIKEKALGPEHPDVAKSLSN
jgi:hypothetical protein